MKLSVALFFAGLSGALGTLCVLLAFGTDYWLLAWESCGPAAERGELGVANSTTFYHEGFFWKCSSTDDGADAAASPPWKRWLANQPKSKVCVHAYLFPFPVDHHAHNATNYQSAIIYRGFWSVFMLMGVAAVVLGGFVIICAAPFASHRLYQAGGGLFLVAGVLLLAVVIMYVLWLQVLDVVASYVEYRRAASCPAFRLSLHYGPSFALAPVGVFFALLSGLLFLLIGRSVRARYR